MNEYKYHLEVYRNASQKTRCPACGMKRFVRYVDEQGNYIADEVGRCDREDSCGYHLTPKQYFEQHPDMTGDDWKKSYINKQQEEPARPIDYIPASYVEAIRKDEFLMRNNLYRFFQIFGADLAQQAFNKYHVGTSAHWRSLKGGLATAFPQIDTQGNVHQIKVIMYEPNYGHRLHEHDVAEIQVAGTKQYRLDEHGSKVWFAGKTIMRQMGNADPNLQQTFFGAHLIPDATDICIVESEKTAMIADLYMGGDTCAWVATGGKNGCRWTTWDVCQLLAGKNVILFPDLKCFDDWEYRAGLLRSYGIKAATSDFLESRCTDEERKQGLDIADYLIKND